MLYTNIWKNIDQKILDRLDQNSSISEYKRGEVIYAPGDKPQGLYVVISGLVGLTIIGKESGKEHLMRFFTSGQFFGHRALFSDQEYHANTIALEKTTLKFIRKQNLISILDEYPILYKDLLGYVAEELKRCENFHVLILENQILSRTAQAIIYLKNLHPEHHWTRQEIANFTASTTSTIIKAMAQLEDLELIKQTGRTIEILDIQGLLSLQSEEK